MLYHHFFSLTVVAALALLSSALPNIPTSVNLRVEGLTTTIFEGTILTFGHNVTTPSGGNHHCDGTNDGQNPLPGPTCTSALDDASKIFHFPFDGYVQLFFLISRCEKWCLIVVGNRYSTFSTAFDDFFITSIGGDTQTATQFWGILLNFEFTPVGGCQQQVKHNDQILFAFDAFNANAFLELSGPPGAHVNTPIVVTVKDGQTGNPIAGASVGGTSTDASGHASVVFTHPGLQSLKATKAGAIRSNKINVLVVWFL